MSENERGQSPLHWLVSDSPPAGGRQPVVLDIGDEDAACLSGVPCSLCTVVVLTDSLASARQVRRLLECEVVVGSATAIPIVSRGLQAIGCFRQFQRIVDKETTCREWLRTLRPQGRVLAVVKLAEEAGQGRRVTAADWSAYFSQRGLVVDRTHVTLPFPEADNIAHVRLRAPSEEPLRVFFSGPFPEADAQRLSVDIEEGLLRRRTEGPGPASGGKHPAVADRGGVLPLPPHLDEADVNAFTVLGAASAPLFARTVGGRVTRLAKVVLNLPLRLLGRPQELFNRMVRDALGVCLRVFREVTDSQRLLRNELSIQRAAVDRLLNENARLRERVEEVELRLGDVADRPETAETAGTRQRPSESQGDDT